MKNSFKNAFLLDKKELSLAGVSEKWKKLTSTSHKIHKQKYGFSENKMLPPNFKNFNKALNKRILFLPDRKSVSTSWNEELVKKYVSI